MNLDRCDRSMSSFFPLLIEAGLDDFVSGGSRYDFLLSLLSSLGEIAWSKLWSMFLNMSVRLLDMKLPSLNEALKVPCELTSLK